MVLIDDEFLAAVSAKARFLILGATIFIGTGASVGAKMILAVFLANGKDFAAIIALTSNFFVQRRFGAGEVG